MQVLNPLSMVRGDIVTLRHLHNGQSQVTFVVDEIMWAGTETNRYNSSLDIYRVDFIATMLSIAVVLSHPIYDQYGEQIGVNYSPIVGDRVKLYLKVRVDSGNGTLFIPDGNYVDGIFYIDDH